VYLHLLALNALGASIVPLHSLGTDEDLHYMIEHSNCRLAVVADEYRARLESLLADLDHCDVVGESDLGESSGPHPEMPTDLATEAALVYTSGTTGKPKGCMLSNEYFLALGIWYNDLGGICSMDANDRLLTPLPPNHMNALCTSFTAMMLCGGCVVQLDRFHPRSWWQSIREEKATIMHCLGVMVAILLTLPEAEADDFSGQIKFCFGPGPDPRHAFIVFLGQHFISPELAELPSFTTVSPQQLTSSQGITTSFESFFGLDGRGVGILPICAHRQRLKEIFLYIAPGRVTGDEAFDRPHVVKTRTRTG
jgi:acyl-CoA synthetase (AMP-forming)/AMP-acid ligase II